MAVRNFQRTAPGSWICQCNGLHAGTRRSTWPGAGPRPALHPAAHLMRSMPPGVLRLSPYTNASPPLGGSTPARGQDGGFMEWAQACYVQPTAQHGCAQAGAARRGGGRRRHGTNACAGALGRWPCRQQRIAPPVRHLMVVVLPAPLGPSRQNRRSRSIANQLPLMAQNSPRRARRRRGPPPSSRPPQQLRQPPQNRQLRELHVGRGCGRHERAG